MTNRLLDPFPDGDPSPIADRGLLKHAPENTLPAFAACLELGMGFELDIRTTKAGHLVVSRVDKVASSRRKSDCAQRVI
ncbi:MAG: glycerophosphodiester phosphodiesterase family protein [Fuerstiella sp.]